MSNQYPPNGGQGNYDPNFPNGGYSGPYGQQPSGNDYGSYPQYGNQTGQYGNQQGQYGGQQGQYGGEPYGYDNQGYQGQGYQQHYGNYDGQYQQPAAAAPYGAPPAPEKKGVAPWVWIVAGLAAVALVVGGIFGVMALRGNQGKNGGDELGTDATVAETQSSGGGETPVETEVDVVETKSEDNGGDTGGGEASGEYGIHSTTGVTDIVLNGINDADYSVSEYGENNEHSLTAMSSDANCVMMAQVLPEGADGVTTAQLGGAMGDLLSEMGDANGLAEELGPVTIADSNGLNVEFMVVRFSGDFSGVSEAYAIIHTFPDTGQMMMGVGLCVTGEAMTETQFTDVAQQLDFTLKP